eukprot:2920870-Rhodomonas_salina.1
MEWGREQAEIWRQMSSNNIFMRTKSWPGRHGGCSQWEASQRKRAEDMLAKARDESIHFEGKAEIVDAKTGLEPRV